mmetsp:Transcript_183624/g.582459  ORF Transcript_183624/g.582459 Transcript_183624/m.582459 type:complete len:219 (+) Transcript_183624:163-819(+)
MSNGKDASTMRLAMAEIGIFTGETGRFVMEVAENLTYIGIDPFRVHAESSYLEQEPDMDDDLKTKSGFVRVNQLISEVAVQCGHGEPSEILASASSGDSCFFIMQMTSARASEFIPDGSLDFVFVDGDHSFEGALLDITMFLPKLKGSPSSTRAEDGVGGSRIRSIMAGHDCCGADSIMWFPGVLQALVEAFKGPLGEQMEAPTLHVGHDGTWWVYLK